MRTVFVALLLGLLVIPAGCGAPESADTTGLDTPEAEAAAQQAREQMSQHGAGEPGQHTPARPN